ncbi:MMPL family transporter [Agromyces intestinalis]|uniref:MMPL family transporter n=1 Tax=Agromyces intestinalis TaxID=2592652 RepID=A0A5C1YEA9_9MICO|nr:MMPL family transporter [Agromyces intestinalis]QEO14423.1 MMPL family transporter [Agromyces intestinalis]
MAELLYRLGRFAARRAWTVVIGWLVVLGLAGGAFLAFGGTLATSFSIPGTETARVTDQLEDEIGGIGGATGTVVFQTDGAAFTPEQQAAIADVLDEIDGIDGVSGVVDPFRTAADRDEQAQQLSDGEAQLADGAAQLDQAQAQLDAGQQQLDAARAQADAGQAQLDQAVQQATDAGVDQLADQFAAQQAQLDAGIAELDAQQAQLDEGQQQLDDHRAELDTNAAQLDAGQRLLEASTEIRTVSEDGTTALGAVLFEDTLFTLAPETKTAVADALTTADIDGVSIDYSAEIASSTEGLVGVGELVGVLVAAVVLIVMLRALLPALLPLISALIGVGVGVAGSLAFSGLVDMSSVTPVLGVMLGLAVGIDYTLFIINRHRRQLLAGVELHESIGLANGTSGNAVVFAGSTVLVALLALNVTGIPFLGVMGTVGAACVLIAVLIAVTLTPAMLGLLKLRVLGRKARAQIGHEDHAAPVIRPMRTSTAILSLVASVVGLLIIAAPALSMRLGLPTGSSEATDSTQYQAYTAVADGFGEGQNGPILVVGELPEAVEGDDVVLAQADLADWLMAQDDVVAVAPVGVSDDGEVMAFQVIPAEGPTSESTEALVHALRDASPVDDAVAGLDGDVKLGVAGQASGNIDISQKLADALPVYLAVVIGLSLLIMIVVFRSLVVPLVATGGFVLSLFAAFGAIVAVYQWGWLGGLFGVHDPGPVLNFAPIIIMGVLFGLAMDYQLFLVSGMREAYVHGLPARNAVIAGLRNGRAVVTAAALIMVSVFGGFVFSHLGMVRPLGFGLAIGVLFDAFVVRMVLVPAIMHLVGRGAWWLPRWLDRIIPNVDVEGAALERTHHVHGVAHEAK